MQLYAIEKTRYEDNINIEVKIITKLYQNIDGYYWMNIKTKCNNYMKYKTLTDAIFDLKDSRNCIELNFFIDDESALEYIKSSSS